MKLFAFALENLLRHRKNVEEQARIELARAAQKHRDELEYLRSLELKQESTLRELRESQEKQVDRDEIGWFYRYMDRLRLECEMSRRRLSALEQELEKRRAAVVECSRQSKILSSLKRKKYGEYVTALGREEQRALDELVATRFVPKEL